MTEIDIAAAVVRWLTISKWDVYQEVQFGRFRADIVAVLPSDAGARLWAIECKRGLGLDVLAQAVFWRSFAHYVSVAVGRPCKHTAGHSFGWSVVEHFDLGLLQVSEAYADPADMHVEESIGAPLRRRVSPGLRDCLRPEQRTSVAGSPSGGDYWTPFRGTCAAIVQIARAEPGITLAEVLRNRGRFHYSTPSAARTSLAHWLRHGLIRGVRVEYDDRRLRLFPIEETESHDDTN